MTGDESDFFSKVLIEVLAEIPVKLFNEDNLYFKERRM